MNRNRAKLPFIYLYAVVAGLIGGTGATYVIYHYRFVGVSEIAFLGIAGLFLIGLKIVFRWTVDVLGYVGCFISGLATALVLASIQNPGHAGLHSGFGLLIIAFSSLVWSRRARGQNVR